MYPTAPREYVCKIRRIALSNERVCYLANAMIRKDLIAFEELLIHHLSNI